MNLLDLTTIQLKRAASIKEQINHLNGELAKLLRGAANNGTKRSRLSPAARRRIALAQKRRWAKVRNAKADKPATKSVKKSKMSAATRAKVSARMKRYWAAKKAGKKSKAAATSRSS